MRITKRKDPLCLVSFNKQTLCDYVWRGCALTFILLFVEQPQLMLTAGPGMGPGMPPAAAPQPGYGAPPAGMYAQPGYPGQQPMPGGYMPQM